MKFVFWDKALKQMYETGEGPYPPSAIQGFFKCMGVIKYAVDEREFYKKKSLHYEKLEGSRKGERSMKLNDGWRLILEMKNDETCKMVLVKEVTNHYD